MNYHQQAFIEPGSTPNAGNANYSNSKQQKGTTTLLSTNSNDIRLSYAKLFATAFNSFDFKAMEDFLESYCVLDFIFVYEIVGQGLATSPEKTRHLEVKGVKELSEYWYSEVVLAPDSIFVLNDTKIRTKGDACCILSSFTLSGTKLYEDHDIHQSKSGSKINSNQLFIPYYVTPPSILSKDQGDSFSDVTSHASKRKFESESSDLRDEGSVITSNELSHINGPKQSSNRNLSLQPEIRFQLEEIRKKQQKVYNNNMDDYSGNQKTLGNSSNFVRNSSHTFPVHSNVLPSSSSTSNSYLNMIPNSLKAYFPPPFEISLDKVPKISLTGTLTLYINSGNGKINKIEIVCSPTLNTNTSSNSTTVN